MPDGWLRIATVRDSSAIFAVGPHTRVGWTSVRCMTRGKGPADLNEEFVRSLPDTGPVVMVNLVRFREHSRDGDGSGWDAYLRYSKADVPLLKREGGIILWAGHVEGAALGDLGDGRWDWVVVVWYPSRAAFLAMMTSSEYAIANVDRENAIEDHVILAANETYSKFKP